MGKDKLKRFAENETFGNMFDHRNDIKGQWDTIFFKNGQDIVLELGCGRGEYTVNLGKQLPDKNFIGVDIKGARLWRGAKTALEEGLSNIAFLRIQIETLENFFDKGEVSEIWITFPDPQPQISRARKRLTSPRFLAMYHRLLKKGGRVHLKTDNDGLYTYTLEMAEKYQLNIHTQTDNLYHSPLVDEVLSIKTTYEAMYLKDGKNINYISFSYPDDFEIADWKKELRDWSVIKLSG